MANLTEADETAEGGRHDEAAIAFDALRRTVEKLARNLDGEITVIRKALELALDEFEQRQPQPDDCEDLSQMADDMVLIAQHVKALELSRAMRYGPEDYRRLFEMLVDRAVVDISRANSGRGGDTDLATELQELVRSGRERVQQDRWLLIAAGGGLIAGILLTSIMLRLFGAH